MSTTQLTAEPPCPNCHQILDGCTAVQDGATPSPGDFTVCGYCGCPLVFEGEPLQLRIPTTREQLEMISSPEYMQVLRAVNVHVALHGGQETRH